MPTALRPCDARVVQTTARRPRRGASSVPRAHPRRWLTFPHRRRRVRARRAAAHDAVMSLAEYLLVHDEIVLEARRRGAALVFFSRRVLARLLLFARHARGRRGFGVLLDADASRGRSRLRRAPGGPSVAGRENPGGAFEPLEHHIDDQRSFRAERRPLGFGKTDLVLLTRARAASAACLRKPVFFLRTHSVQPDGGPGPAGGVRGTLSNLCKSNINQRALGKVHRGTVPT